MKKHFSFSRYLNVCLDFLILYKKRFDYKNKVNFKTYDVTTKLKNNGNTHTVQYLMKWRQPSNAVWSGNRI